MLHFRLFSEGIHPPVPASPTYHPRQRGSGWPDQCPPLRAANAFGFDVLASHTMTFTRKKFGWKHEDPVDVTANFIWEPEGQEGTGGPLTQRNAWFWDRGQELPHRISEDVWPHLQNQVKVSSFLYLHTDPDELLWIGEIPNRTVPYRAFAALLDTDTYPASYPWHGVLTLDRRERSIVIEQGTPIFRLMLVRRSDYVAAPMNDRAFDAFFSKGQTWLRENARAMDGDTADIRGAYARLQQLSTFTTKSARSERPRTRRS